MNTAQNPGPGIWGPGIWGAGNLGGWDLEATFHSNFSGCSWCSDFVGCVLAVCWLAIYVMARLRDSNTQGVPLHDLVQKNFEEMRSGSDISDVEFRKITSLLAEKPRRPSLPMENPTSGSNDVDSDEKSH